MHLPIRYARPAALIWLMAATIVFCLPGSALPKAGWLASMHADKWVHVGIFTLLSFFWGMACGIRHLKQHLVLWLLALTYGILIEIVQDRFVANRSMDGWDVVFDMVGALLGSSVLAYLGKDKPL